MDEDLDKIVKKADSLLNKNQPSKAVAVIKEAIREFSKNPYLYYLLGIARMKCGRFFLAKRALKKADNLLPQNSENLRSLGWVKIMLGELKEGRNDLRRAINLDLTNHLAYLDLAMSYFHYFEFKKGFEWLNRAKELCPNDPLILQNYKIAEENERNFYKFSEADRREMEKEKLNPEFQQEFHFSVLERFFKGKALTEDEKDEIMEELELNGFKPNAIDSGDRFGKLPSKKEIIERRKDIEKKLLQMLKKIKSPFTIDYIKDVIYHEKSHDDLKKIISIFEEDESLLKFEDVVKIVNDAWNYFPHQCLSGLCPVEKILEEKKGQDE